MVRPASSAVRTERVCATSTDKRGTTDIERLGFRALPLSGSPWTSRMKGECDLCSSSKIKDSIFD